MTKKLILSLTLAFALSFGISSVSASVSTSDGTSGSELVYGSKKDRKEKREARRTKKANCCAGKTAENGKTGCCASKSMGAGDASSANGGKQKACTSHKAPSQTPQD